MIKIASNKVRWVISAFFALLILFGTYSNVFSLAAFLGCCLMVVFFEKESILLQLFFIMPMANIFKLSPTSQSFFTILLLLYVALHLVLPRKATTLVILFGIYVVVGELFAGQFNLFRTIKFICNILFLSSILNDKVKLNNKEIFFSYIIGNIVSSVFGLMDSDLFRINDYVGVMEFINPEMEIDVFRFVGLYPDPNYYSIGLVVSLCLLVLMYYRNDINSFVMTLFGAPIIYFLVMTYSKSAIIMILVVFIFLLYTLFHKKKHAAALMLIGLLAMIVVLALSGAIPMLDVVISRILAADTGNAIDVNTLTTGRFNIWVMYIKNMAVSVKTIFFGDSITAELVNGRASHNTYLDIFYNLGLVGGILLFASLKAILSQSMYSKFKRNIINYSILICILTMYFFLGELFYYDPPFQIFLAFVALNLPLEENKIKEKCSI